MDPAEATLFSFLFFHLTSIITYHYEQSTPCRGCTSMTYPSYPVDCYDLNLGDGPHSDTFSHHCDLASRDPPAVRRIGTWSCKCLWLSCRGPPTPCLVSTSVTRVGNRADNEALSISGPRLSDWQHCYRMHRAEETKANLRPFAFRME